MSYYEWVCLHCDGDTFRIIRSGNERYVKCANCEFTFPWSAFDVPPMDTVVTKLDNQCKIVVRDGKFYLTENGGERDGNQTGR